ncbi:hypothetical protein I204_01840 [Kwoniella mangroviensis CBS 8886]|nr:hypothetical protein I204_01840 [Kwoniella mangroviensis CBS 8886]
MISLKPLEEDAASSDDGALERLRAPYPKAAQASMTQRDAFTLSNLPEDIKRRLQDSNILSKFSTIEFHFRTRSDGSILPQLTRTLPEYYKTPETESGRLSSLPVDNKTNEGRDPDNYKWETLDFTSEVELCVDVNSDRTKVLPWYDEERAKETMRSVMGDWKSIPAVSVCYVKASNLLMKHTVHIATYL